MIWTAEIESELLNTEGREELLNFAKKYALKYVTVERRRNLIKARGIEHTQDKNLYYEKQITALQRQVVQLTEDIDYMNILEKTATKYIEALPKVKVPIYSQEKQKVVYEIANLILSDLHIGEIVDLRDMGGINEYNFDIFSRRMKHMARSITSIKEKLKGYNLPHLEIHALGDMITGVIHDELLQNAEETVIEWLFNGALVISQFLSELLNIFESIHFTGVIGNHGRLSQKVTYKKRYVNWDHILYKILKIMMVQNDRITFDLPRSFWTIREVGGRRLLLLHGDNIKSWAGIPFYGIQRATHRLTEILAANEQYFDDILLAHFHNLGTLSRAKGKIIINGSVVGSNEFSVGHMFMSSEPMQMFFGINPKHKKRSWEFPLNLDNTEKSGKYTYSGTIT